jgi:uncharacterized protein (TIGR00661 family)
MKILYAVQATGNGHISRAHQLYPYICEQGDVDIMLSGSNASLNMDIPVKYRSQGMSLFYSQCGGLDYKKTWSSFNYQQIKRDIASLPVEKYDLIINDFDYVTARACKQKKVPSIQFGHQGSFMSTKTPRPASRSFIGEFILKNYAPATHYVGLHFDRYDNFIFPPVIKDIFIGASPKDHGHITVYLPAYQTDCIEQILKEISPIEVHWFLPNISKPYKIDNITYYPVNQQYFNNSLIHCHGLLTGGGFETPAEALYLGKNLITIPIDGQYEQQCNSAALEQIGIPKMRFLNKKTKSIFLEWVYQKQNVQKIKANNIKETLTYITNL